MPHKPPTMNSLIHLLRQTYARALAECLPEDSAAAQTGLTLIANRLLRTLARVGEEPKRPGRRKNRLREFGLSQAELSAV
jgi:hypothetical protein